MLSPVFAGIYSQNVLFPEATPFFFKKNAVFVFFPLEITSFRLYYIVDNESTATFLQELL